MSDIPNQIKPSENTPLGDTQEAALVQQVNSALLNYSDKDWNYSRIHLTINPLASVEGPYMLRLELLDQNTKDGRQSLKTLADEVKWGDRHSSELGMLEVVSLRINKALLEVTSDDYWNQRRPVVRIVKKQPVGTEASAHAIWYCITEVAGEEFDNR